MKVKVSILFSKNDKIGSKLISWGTSHLNKTKNKTPSHVSVLINKRWILEATFDKGVIISNYKDWKNDHKIVFKKELKDQEYNIVKSQFKEIKGRKYDWLGVIFLALTIASNKAFKTKLPKKNLWENPDRFFCTEAACKLLKITDNGVKSPVQIMTEMDNIG